MKVKPGMRVKKPKAGEVCKAKPRVKDGLYIKFDDAPMPVWFSDEELKDFVFEEDFVTKTLKTPMEFKSYLYLTVAHLIVIEGLFVYAAMAYPDYERGMAYVNYMYMLVVILHGIHWFQKRLYFVPKMLHSIRPYIEAFEGAKDELGMSPEEMVVMMRTFRGKPTGERKPTPPPPKRD